STRIYCEYPQLRPVSHPLLYSCARRDNRMNCVPPPTGLEAISTGFYTCAWKTAETVIAPLAPDFTVRLSEVIQNVCWLLVFGCVAVRAQSGDAEKLAPYYPTPETIVEKMLQ